MKPTFSTGPTYELSFDSAVGSKFGPCWTTRAPAPPDGTGRPSGSVSVRFYGPLAQDRAIEYTTWMNSQSILSFKVGDVVHRQLGQSGPGTNEEMTIEHIMSNGTICLAWFSDTPTAGYLHSTMLNAHDLVLATK